MDIGVYCVYPIIYFFGKPKDIVASCTILESGVDGQGTLCLKYDNMEAVVIHSKITDSVMPSEIQGEKGSITIDNAVIPKKIAIHYRDGKIQNVSKSQKSDEMYYEAKEFIDLIKTRKNPVKYKFT